MKNRKIIITNHLSELETLTVELEAIGEDWGIITKHIFNLNLVLEELITNIIFYAFDDKKTHQIYIDLSLENNNLSVISNKGFFSTTILKS